MKNTFKQLNFEEKKNQETKKLKTKPTKNQKT